MTVTDTVTDTAYDSAVAIVGMAGRFPGAADVDTLWRNLLAGVGGLRTISDEELARAGVEPQAAADPGYVRVGGPVGDIDLFDAAVFGFSPQEAEAMEPQHRLFLECAWEALERAGYRPTQPEGSVGVFGGCGFPDYMVLNAARLAGDPATARIFATGNERDSLTSLVSYKLGLRGPSVTVQTFCSTSLVAVHLACQSLLTYECDMTLAGGAYLPLPQPAGYRYEEGGILSPDGRVRSLDAAANGTVMGSGAAVVALKRLADALAEGDVIHAVILGSAVNNDGQERAGYAAPGIDGQAAVVEAALAVAGVKPQSVGYVECHAVGTPLGDSIELAALSRVFHTAPPEPCVLGSIKPLIGHLDRASGVTALIRAALCVREGVLPGTPGFATPNPALAAAADRFTVLAEDRAWPPGDEPRRAGVNSFAVGGTNAHVVLEQPPPRTPRRPSKGPYLLTFSAADSTALDALTRRLREHLAARQGEDLADVAYTLHMSRGRFALRRAVVCHDYQDAVAALDDPGRWIDGEARRRDPRVRVAAEGAATDPWWTRLAQAAAALLSDGNAPASQGTVDRDGALAVLTRVLTRLGVRIVDTAQTAAGAGAGAETVLAVPGGEPADVWVLTTLARLWQAGAPIDWSALDASDARRVELPPYPFQRRRFWLDAAPAEPDQRSAAARWQRGTPPVARLDERLRAAGPWLVLADEECGDALAERLVLAGAEVFTVRPGDGLREEDSGEFTVSPADPASLSELLRTLLVVPRTIVHALSLASPDGAGIERFEAELDRGVRGGVALARALAEYEAGFAEHGEEPPAIDVVLLTSAAVSITGADPDHPEHAAFAALAPSINVGGATIVGRHIDAADDADIDLVLAASICRPEGPRAVRGHEAWLLRGPRTPSPDDTSDLGGSTAPGSASVASSSRGPSAAAGGPRPRPSLATAFVEPSPGPEETVARLWAQSLGLERVGVDDNFFELGGRSMTAVQLAQRVGAELGAALPVTALIEQPTVRLLCAGLTPGTAPATLLAQTTRTTQTAHTAQTSQGGNP